MRVALCAVLFLITTLSFGVSVSALDITKSPPNKPNSPLIMTEILIDENNQAKYIQIYNNSSDIIDLSKYHINHLDSKGELIDQNYITESGYLEPDCFLLLANDDLYENNSDLVSRLTLDTEILNGDVLEIENSNGKFNNNSLKIDNFEVNTRYSRYKSSAGNYTSNTSFRVLNKQDVNLYSDGVYSPDVLSALLISEVLANPNDCSPDEIRNDCMDYIKLYNNQNFSIDLSKFRLRYGDPLSQSSNSNTINLDGLKIEPNEFININKNNNNGYINLASTGGYVWFEDKYGLENYSADIVKFPSSSSSKGLGWAKFDNGWGWSIPTPLHSNVKYNETVSPYNGANLNMKDCSPNQFLNPITNRCKKIETKVQPKVCDDNHFLNPSTNRCKKNLEEKPVKICQSGQFLNPKTNRCKKFESRLNHKKCSPNQFLNPETGRCKKVATLALAKLTPCKEGWYRNPETNRCRKIKQPEKTKVCKDGQELNHETNRCRKIRQSSEGMNKYKPELKTDNDNDIPAILALSVLGVIGVGIGIFQNKDKLIRMIKGL